MRFAFVFALVAALACTAWAQSSFSCSCGKNPPGPPAPRSLKPYAGAPEDLRPFSKFTAPYHEYYQDLIEYNGAARDIPDPDPKDLARSPHRLHWPALRPSRSGSGQSHAQWRNLAIDEANAAGGYGGKPFKLMLTTNNWQLRAIWGADQQRDRQDGV